MKKSIIITVIIALFSVIGANAQTEKDQFKIQVDGLGCPFCAYGLEKKFKEFKGIKDVNIEIETGNFTFTYPTEKALSLEAVEKQVEKAGYTPMSTEIIRANGAVETSSETKDIAINTDNLKESSLLVAGKCGMCEARIVKATKSITGVSEATWNEDSKMLQVSFDESQTSDDAIEKAIAKVGHDTKKYKATDEAYKNLPACCKYERLDQ